MAVSGRRRHPDHDESWKLKDKVKVMKICCTSYGNEKLLQGDTKPIEKFKQGPKVTGYVAVAVAVRNHHLYGIIRML